MDPIEAKMAEELAKQFGGEQTSEPKTENNEAAKPVELTPVTQEAKPENLEVPKEVVSEQAKPVEERLPKTEEVKNEPTPEQVKSFEDLLAERSGGKFKSWDEIEKELTPKEVFANEKIKKLNELAQKGVDVTSKEFLELQSLDLDKITQTDDILFEKWKRSEEGKGLSDKTIRYEINKKYNVNEWISKDDSELTDDDIANREKMLRDAGLAKDWLVNYKNERTLEKQVDPAQQEAMAKQAQEAQKSWEQYVDSNLVNKVTKLSIPISYKDETGKVVESNFDYSVTPQELKEVGDMMKQLTTNSNVFFGQFRDQQGNANHEQFFKFVLQARNFEKAVALAASDAAEKRALAIERASKNTNFKPSEVNTAEKVFATDEEALRDAVAKQKVI